jgi:hypothetical protein
MRPKTYIGLNGLPLSGFDFVVAERPKYIPGSGPPLAPISAIPVHDRDGFIINKVQFQKQLRYLVGYEDQPHLRVSVQPQNILDWVSRWALEKWESDSYEAEERRREEEELPAILAKEERRRKRLEAMSRAAKGVDGRKLKRKRIFDDDAPRKTARLRRIRMRSPPKESPPGPLKAAGRRAPGQRHQVEEEEVVFTSPRLSQHSQQQPSLSTPSRRLVNRNLLDSESEEIGSIDTDLALDLQLKGLPSMAQSSRSVSASLDPGEETSTSTRSERDSSPASPLYGQSAVAATSSREALKIYEELERKKNPDAALLSRSPKSPFKRKLYPIFDKPSKPSLSIPLRTQPSPLSVSKMSELEPEPEEESEEEKQDQKQNDEQNKKQDEESSEEPDEGGEESEYEVNAILDEQVRKEDGRRVLYYLINWVGDYANSWEPMENVGDEAIRVYKEKRRRDRIMGIDGTRESSDDGGSFVTPEKPKYGDMHGKAKGTTPAEPHRGRLMYDQNDDEDEVVDQLSY